MSNRKELLRFQNSHWECGESSVASYPLVRVSYTGAISSALAPDFAASNLRWYFFWSSIVETRNTQTKDGTRTVRSAET